MKQRRHGWAGLPATSLLTGALVGGLVAWFGRELRAFHRQQRFARCPWCNDHLTDRTDPQQRSQMLVHLARCTSFPLPAMAQVAVNGVGSERLAS